jgi:uncharacterized protein
MMVQRQDWKVAALALDSQGWAPLPKLLNAKECAKLRGLYDKADFRRSVVMARHGFGQGEYKYFAYPLPKLVASLRAALYAELAPIANRWAGLRHEDVTYPASHQDYLKCCHQSAQNRPTPLLLKYGQGDYNCLHQDVYGAHVFPLQVAILLSEPGEDFRGGEFVMTEQRPRAQSRASVVPLSRGDGVAFAAHRRPVRGRRGVHTVKHRHGVSMLVTGERYTLGVIFHDAT